VNGYSQYETEATGRFGVLVQTHNDLLDFPSARKELVNLLLRRVKRHVPDVNGGWSQKRLLKILLRSGESSVSVRRKLRRILQHSPV